MNLEQAKEILESQMREPAVSSEYYDEMAIVVKTLDDLMEYERTEMKREGCLNPEGKGMCNLGYACDGCPRNPDLNKAEKRWPCGKCAKFGECNAGGMVCAPFFDKGRYPYFEEVGE